MVNNNFAKARILVVDNLDDFIARWTRILQRHGYDVRGFHATTSDWLEKCIETAFAFQPHVALVDLRIEDEYRPSDISGITLLTQLKVACPSIQVVVYSAYLDSALDRQISAAGAEFFKKGDDPKQLLQIIETMAAKASSATRISPIQWPVYWDQEQILVHLLESSELPAEGPANRLDDLVHQLFPESRNIRISGIEEPVDTSSKLVSAGRSFVAIVSRDDLPVKKIVKVAPRLRISTEVDRYHLHIKDQLGGVQHTQLEKSALSWHIGISVYTFLSNEHVRLPLLMQFVRDVDNVDQLWVPIKNFFGNVWKHHYQTLIRISEKSLWEEYETYWSLSRRLERFSASTLHLNRELCDKLLDPVQWSLKYFRDIDVMPVCLVVTHGDLHSENLFTDGERLWAIDFERTGYGHILRDFCELAVDLITRGFAPDDIDQRTFHEFTRALFGTASTFPVRLSTPSMQKLFFLTQKLQYLALQLTDTKMLEEYYCGLLLNALYVLSGKPNNSRNWYRQRAWILASVLCERLYANMGV